MKIIRQIELSEADMSNLCDCRNATCEGRDVDLTLAQVERLDIIGCIQITHRGKRSFKFIMTDFGISLVTAHYHHLVGRSVPA